MAVRREDAELNMDFYFCQKKHHHGLLHQYLQESNLWSGATEENTAFSPADRCISFSFTLRQCQGIPRVGVSFTALDFISLVWNLIWFQDSSKEVQRFLPTSENFTPRQRAPWGLHGWRSQRELPRNCHGTLALSWPLPDCTISVCLLLSYGMWNFQMQNTHNCIITILFTFKFFSPTTFHMECWWAAFLLFQPFSKTLLNISNCTS